MRFITSSSAFGLVDDVPGAALPGSRVGGAEPAGESLDLCDHPASVPSPAGWSVSFPRPFCPPTSSATCGTDKCRPPASIPIATFPPILIWPSCAISISTPTSIGATYAHTIYPPGAQMLFLLITRIGASVRWMKAGMVGLESLTIWILVKLLSAVGVRREQVLIYAWHPMVVLGGRQQRPCRWRGAALNRARVCSSTSAINRWRPESPWQPRP